MKSAVIIPNFNSATTVVRAVEAMLAQEVGAEDSLRVVVVDDGSTDGSADVLASAFGERITLIRMPLNRGRSTGRNAGAAAAAAELLVFVDSDCIPQDQGFVAAHLASTKCGADISFGEVCTPGAGFWDRLQHEAIAERLRRFEHGDEWVFTTQNVAIRSTFFVRVGGFDQSFDRHGFEDRDLFLRLAAVGAEAVYTPTARVRHEDRISLINVARKFGQAGLHSARTFRERHPLAYAQMPFSRIDAGLHPWLRWADAVISPVAQRLAASEAQWLEWRWLPFSFRQVAAKAIYGWSYLHGTVLAGRSPPFE